MKKQEIIDTLSVIQKSHFQDSTNQIDKEGYPGNRRSYLYDVIDPDTDEVYPPPYFIELAYKHATGNKLPKEFFADIGKDTGHFNQLRRCGFLVESKLDPKRINEAIRKLNERAELFALYSKDSSALFNNATKENILIKEAFKEEKSRWEPKPNQFQPVVLFRYLLFQNIKNGNAINEALIEKTKNEILSKNIDPTYNLSQSFIDLVKKHPDKDYFQSWKKPFSIMFPFFYSRKFKRFTTENLGVISNYIKEKLELKEVKTNIVGFEGAQNFGTDHAWMALYPNTFKSVQEAYQLFVHIGENGFSGGLYKGHKVDNDEFIAKTYEFENIDDCINTMLSLVDDWRSLNLQLNKSDNIKPEYYHISPGSKGTEWSEFYHNKYMAISYDNHDIGALDHFKSRADLMKKSKLPPSSIILQTLDLMRLVEPGIILLANNGVDELLGIGVLEGNYTFHNGEEYPHRRRVNWIVNKRWEYKKERLWGYPNAFRTDTFSKSKIGGFILAMFIQDNPQYYKALKDAGINPVVSNEEIEDHFNYFLKDLTAKSKKNYLGAIKKISAICKVEGLVKDSLYELHTRQRLSGVKSVLEKNKEYTAINDDGNNMYSSALSKYEELINELNITYHWEVKTSTTSMKKPLNSIFYGPPGTGKTYKLKTHYFPKYTTKETSLSADKNFERVVSELTWFEAIAIAMLEKSAPISVPELKENRWIVRKAKYSETKNIGAGLWGQLQAHTIENCEFVNYKNRQSPLIFKKNEDKSWEISMDDFEDLTPELADVLDNTINFQASPDKEIKHYEFVTFHQSYAYEDFIEGIKPVMETEGDGELRYEIKDGLFKTLCQHAKNDPENKYAIFIDEINRGNVSSIFGELITLIEPDKRLGMENAMTATLPYSRESFGVPSNVDIYGTMNTADRSVEALDTALRRRFAFQEMLPKPDLLNDIDKISLKELLLRINGRIEALIDRDHTIGHSYLINVRNMEDLKLAFKDKIIPLLQEYFYGDYGKIGLVLGSGFVKIQTQDNEIFADFEYEGSDGLAQNKFELISFEDKNFNFEKAIKTLLNNSGE